MTYSLNKTVPSDAEFTDANVAQTASTDNSEYAILLRSNTGTTGDTSGAKFGSSSGNLMTANPSTGTITATKFKGALEGNADTATSATFATTATSATD
jgi:hypothetical protein